jgi:hypothetical protein
MKFGDIIFTIHMSVIPAKTYFLDLRLLIMKIGDIVIMGMVGNIL